MAILIILFEHDATKYELIIKVVVSFVIKRT